MFFVIEAWKNVLVKPSQIGPRFERHVTDILRGEVEGQCIPKYGFVVCVLRILVRERGRVQDGTGFVLVPVRYQAVVFQPLKGEVMDGLITSINSMGIFVQCGPVKAFVAKNTFSPDYQLIEGVWCSGDTRLSIDTEIRVRILGFKYEMHGLTAVARIDEDFLGPV